MLIINFLHVSAGIPLLDICGLQLCIRGALDSVGNGFEIIFLLVHPEDSSSVINSVKRRSVVWRSSVDVN